MPELPNSEMNPTSTLMSWRSGSGLGLLTFILLVVGYATRFWAVAPG